MAELNAHAAEAGADTLILRDLIASGIRQVAVTDGRKQRDAPVSALPQEGDIESDDSDRDHPQHGRLSCLGVLDLRFRRERFLC
ncbi:MAG: hypothetical protein IPP84_08500 [Propionivibrio sp.]|uniref:hypothetical protein n=1 Tax=Propionivibrio sp. TaxID=2212460 RepID=UPI0025D54EC5|nr:hypothetical protein [Propionivibrio sp.]MBL0207999.1 hypothetical protein [Propionivibrio sp.]